MLSTSASSSKESSIVGLGLLICRHPRVDYSFMRIFYDFVRQTVHRNTSAAVADLVEGSPNTRNLDASHRVISVMRRIISDDILPLVDQGGAWWWSATVCELSSIATRTIIRRKSSQRETSATNLDGKLDLQLNVHRVARCLVADHTRQSDRSGRPPNT